MADLPRNSDAEIQRLRALPYQEYLASVWWRRRRYARLHQAHGKCERCGVVTTVVNVHHVHYDRRGAERDSDLEVLCRTCHEGHHFAESRRQNMGVYMLLARETLRLDKPATPADFREALRVQCKALDLITTDHRFDDAINVLLDTRGVSLVSAARRVEVAAQPDLAPIGKQEAIELCRRLRIEVPFKSMPERFGKGTGVAAQRARAAAWLQAEQCPQCQHVGAQLSGVQLGSLYCTACQHRWELPPDTLETLRRF